MSDEPNSSSTPEIPGNNKTAADESNRQRKTNPEKKSPPRKPRTKKWFGLSETKWREIAGIAVLIPWVWNEFLDTHNFSKLCLLAITIAVAQGATLTFFKSRWRGFILAIWLISLVPVAVVVCINSRPAPTPHFALSLSTYETRNDPLQLTNSVLIKKDWGKTEGFSVFGLLMMPLQFGTTNIEFGIVVKNDSSVTPDDLNLVLTLPKAVACNPGIGWQEVKIDSPGFVANGSTNAEQSWLCRLDPIFPGDSGATPTFQISPNPTNIQTYFSILVKAKDCPPSVVSFLLKPFWMPTNFPPQKGFVFEGKPISSNLMTTPSFDEILSHLHK